MNIQPEEHIIGYNIKNKADERLLVSYLNKSPLLLTNYGTNLEDKILSQAEFESFCEALEKYDRGYALDIIKEVLKYKNELTKRKLNKENADKYAEKKKEYIINTFGDAFPLRKVEGRDKGILSFGIKLAILLQEEHDKKQGKKGHRTARLSPKEIQGVVKKIEDSCAIAIILEHFEIFGRRRKYKRRSNLDTS